MRLPQVTFHTKFNGPRFGVDGFSVWGTAFLGVRLGLIMVILVW